MGRAMSHLSVLAIAFAIVTVAASATSVGNASDQGPGDAAKETESGANPDFAGIDDRQMPRLVDRANIVAVVNWADARAQGEITLSTVGDGPNDEQPCKSGAIMMTTPGPGPDDVEPPWPGTLRVLSGEQVGQCQYTFTAEEYRGEEILMHYAMTGGGFPPRSVAIGDECPNPLACATGIPPPLTIVIGGEVATCRLVDSWIYSGYDHDPVTRSYTGVEFCWTSSGAQFWNNGEHCLAVHGWSVDSYETYELHGPAAYVEDERKCNLSSGFSTESSHWLLARIWGAAGDGEPGADFNCASFYDSSGYYPDPGPPPTGRCQYTAPY